MLKNLFKKKSTFDKGEEFEKWVLENILNHNVFEIINVTPSQNISEKTFIKSVQNPDIEIMYKPTKEKFWIECKYRYQYDQENKIDCCNANQLNRFKKFKEPVFFIIGIGDKPTKIEELYLVPSSKAYPKLFANHAYKYEIKKETLHLKDYIEKLKTNNLV